MIEDVPQAPAADFDPNLLNAADPSRVRFPERFSLEAMTAPEGAVVTEFERTPEGFTLTTKQLPQYRAHSLKNRLRQRLSV
jgi:hypothetical protein